MKDTFEVNAYDGGDGEGGGDIDVFFKDTEAKQNNKLKSRFSVIGKTKPSKCLTLSIFEFILEIYICREGVPAFRTFFAIFVVVF